MEEFTLEPLIARLVLSPTTDSLDRLASCLLFRQNDDLNQVISSSFQSLFTLEQWAWEILSRESRSWLDQQQMDAYERLFSTLSSWNRKVIFQTNDLNNKTALLLPTHLHTIDGIFKQIVERKDDNDRFLSIVNLWFNNLGLLVYLNATLATMPMLVYINERLTSDFLMTEQFKIYLKQLQHPSVTFTPKKEFYLNIPLLFLENYMDSRPPSFIYNEEQILDYLAHDATKIVLIHSKALASSPRELLACIAHLTGLIQACLWAKPKTELMTQSFVLPDTTVYDYLESVIEILSYRPFHQLINDQWSNAETMLIDHLICTVVYFINHLGFNDFFRSQPKLIEALAIFNHAPNDRIVLTAYGVQASVLSETQIKQLNIASNMSKIFFQYLQLASQSPLKSHDKIPLSELLKGYQNLAKNDLIKESTCSENQVSFLVDLCDTYPIVYDILWTLSFHPGIQEQLRSNEIFCKKLEQLENVCPNDSMQKILFGLRWNLNSNVPSADTHGVDKFDVMISYSHKDKQICGQIYEELVRRGYRVWIDFNEMHGNVMDAMAQAIEQSHSIILCISEEYQRSNYCRAEAQYAFKRQLKIIPIVLQKSYKPDGWLLFLIAGLLYVDFTKHAFDQAVQMLLNEFQTSKRMSNPPLEASSVSLSNERPKEVREWTENDVQQWLVDRKLFQMAQLLADVNGLGLIYLTQLMSNSVSQDHLLLFQQDSIQRTGRALSLIELARFQSLIDGELHISGEAKRWNLWSCCQVM